ncbi:NAD/NADP-dependent betaine aldehyde dehydrogenase [Streptomyces hirsutus]
MLSMTIDGKPVDTRDTFDVVNPATGAVEAQAPECTPEQLDQAMTSAARAQKSWKRDDEARRRTLRDLADAVDAHQEELTALLVQETGKPRAVAAHLLPHRRRAAACPARRPPRRRPRTRPARRPAGTRTPRPSPASRSREPSPPAHRVRHRSPGAAARSIQHYGAAQHGVHDHSTIPIVFGPVRDNTPSLLTSGHAVESRTWARGSGAGFRPVDGTGPGVHPAGHGA